MTQQTTPSNQNIAGGSATAAGMNFQAAVAAIAAVYMLRGRPLLWLDGLVTDIPISIEAETGGAGDDIRLLLKSGDTVEVQVKKGLKSGYKLWEPLIALAKAVHEKTINYGVLIVSPTSSNTITEFLSKDIIRLSEGRTDGISDIAKQLVERLDAEKLPIISSCQGIRIQTINAITANQADIRAAQSELQHLCHDHSQITSAWNSIYNDAASAIELRGRRDTSAVLRLLHAEGIKLAQNELSAPIILLDKLCKWVFDTHAYFSIFGVKKKLRVDHAWIPLKVVVQDTADISAKTIAEALKKYQSWNQSIDRDAQTVDPETLGRFVQRAVLVGGPGMGKTTLLKRIARRYSEDNIPVLHMKLKAVAASMQDGKPFEEAAFSLALDGSGINPREAIQAKLSNWLLLCDGLDECVNLQEDVAAGVENFVAGYPDCRVIVTTRPVGYKVAHFSDWRHYSIKSLEGSHTQHHLVTLLSECVSDNNQTEEQIERLCKQELENEKTKEIVARSPLLLGLAASILARGGKLSRTKEALYGQIFQLIDERPNARTPEPPASATILRRYLDIIGWHLTADPLCGTNKLIELSAKDISQDMGCSPFKAQEDASNYIRYWQGVGIIEKIHHGLDDTLSFIHKSFGEFSAARYITHMPTEQQDTNLPQIVDSTNWKEVVEFSAYLGLANNICTLLMHDDKVTYSSYSTEKVNQALKIIAETNSPLEKELHRKIINTAFKTILSDSYHEAFSISDSLASVAKKFPQELGLRANRILNHSQPWTHLIAWSIVTTAGQNYHKHYSLDKVLLTCISNIKNLPTPSLEGKIVRTKNDGRDVLQSLALNIIEIILDNSTDDEKNHTFIDSILDVYDFRTAGFMIDLQSLLKQKEKEGLAELINDAFFANGKIDFFSSDSNQKSWSAFFEMLFESLGIPEDKLSSTNNTLPLLNFSALLDASNMWEMPLSDLRAWLHPYDKTVTKEVLRAFIALSDIELKTLQIEAQQAKSTLYNNAGLLQFDKLSKITIHVDPPKIKWSQASSLELDETKIEAALFNRSKWIVWIATNLIANMLSLSELESLIRRLLYTGTGYTLWAASRLTECLDRTQAKNLLLERASYSPSECKYLIRSLKNHKIEWGVELSNIFQKGLYKDALVAVEVADLSVCIAQPGQTELEILIQDGLAYWVNNEQPYPTKGGIVPPSPRENLLEALIKIRPLTYVEIKLYANDLRPDVREIAENALLRYLEPSNYHNNSEFLTDIHSGALPPYLLQQATKTILSLNPQEIKQWQALTIHENPKIRFSAMSLLNTNHLAEDVIRQNSNLMLGDEEQEIREKATKIISELNKTQGAAA